MEVNGQPYALAGLLLEETVSGTHWTGQIPEPIWT
jgi:hypothetical protein